MKVEQLTVKINEVFSYNGDFHKNDKLLILCFFNEFNPHTESIIQDIHKFFKESIVTGCSGAGTIESDNILDEGVVVTLIKCSEHSRFDFFYESITTEKSFNSGEIVGQKLNQLKANGAIIFTEGLSVDGAQFSHGINSSLSRSVHIIGGLAGEGTTFLNSFVIINNEIIRNKVAVVALIGQLNIGVVANGGWKRFGFTHKVTRSTGSTVQEIDNKPALDFYKEYIGQESHSLPAAGLYYPICIINESGEGTSKHVVRTLLGVDEAKKTLTFAGSIPENSSIDLMRAMDKDLINAADLNKTFLKASFEKFDKKKNSILSLIVSCVGRRLVLGQKSEEELVGFKDIDENAILQTGFYSYGELALNGPSELILHNQTLTQALIWENDFGDENESSP